MAKAKTSTIAQFAEITIPKDDMRDNDQFFSDAKGEVLIKKGIPVKVRRSIAEIYYLSQAQKNSADAYIEQNAK